MKRQQKRTDSRRQQKGAGSTDYAQLFYAYGASPADLSRFTLKNINNAPVFNPLKADTIFPTGTSGIIPTGSYYNSIASTSLQNSLGPPTPGAIQAGGGKKKTNRWVLHVQQFAKQHGLNYAQALKDPRTKNSYHQKNN